MEDEKGNGENAAEQGAASVSETQHKETEVSPAELTKRLKALEADNARLQAESKAAFRARDSVKDKLRGYEEQAKSAELAKLEEEGRLKEVVGSMQSELERYKSANAELTEFVSEKIKEVSKTLPKDLLDGLEDLPILKKSKAVTAAAKSFASIKKAPDPAHAPSTASSNLDLLGEQELRAKFDKMTTAELMKLVTGG